jgi:long-chain acyl-CoA synthetase
VSRLAALLRSFESRGTAPCIVDGDEVHSYADLLVEIDRWRVELKGLGVEPAQVIAIRADYSLTAVSMLLAVLGAKAVAALVPRDSADDRYLDEVCATGVLEIGSDGAWAWRTRDAGSRHALLELLAASGDGGIVLLTSGSTGRPKAALQSTERFLRKFEKPGRSLRTLAFLVFDHVAGLDTLLYTLANGGALVLVRQRQPDTIVSIIQRAGVEVLPASPSFLRLLCMNGAPDMPTLRVITYGSEPMDEQTLNWLNARFPDVQITQKYGTTETGSPRTISRGSDSLWLKFRPGEIETRVVDGILWLRGDSTILGYLNAAAPVDADGWYCTGDLVDVDGEWIRFRGRDSDTINVGGEKVAPAEVEQTILELAFVRSVRVSSEPHVLMGNIVVAQVELAGLAPKLATREIRRHCRSRLAPFKVPVKIDVVAHGLVSERQKVARSGGQQPAT